MIPTLDRLYVPQFTPVTLGLEIHVNGVLSDPDGNVVTVTMKRESDNVTIFTRAATRAEVGKYEVTLSSAEAQTPGNFALNWQYDVATQDRFEETYILIGQAEPAYDDLPENMRAVVDQTWFRFEDLFDSPTGGPNLQTYFQTHFSRGSVAKLLRLAMGRLNTAAQPHQTYTLDGDGGASFPVDKWGPLLEQALYVEVLKHLVRSYVEQPDLIGGNVTRLSRRDYMDRWRMVLQDEMDLLKQQLDVFKISSMNLGRPAVLVSGGVYGRWGPTRYPGAMAARPAYWARYY